MSSRAVGYCLGLAAILAGLFYGAMTLSPRDAEAAPGSNPGIASAGGCNPGRACSALTLTSAGAISGTTVAGTTFTSSVASGSNAFVATNSGARYCLIGACSTRMEISATNQINFYIANGELLRLNGGTGSIDHPTTDPGYTTATASGSNAYQINTNGARMDFGAGSTDYASSDGTTVTFAGPVKSASTLTRGTITLAAGTGTATVLTGAVCVCSDTTANASVQCTVASTTLTATGTGTDVIAYVCF